MFQVVAWKYRPVSTPPSAASAAAPTHTVRMTRSTPMPEAAARAGLSDTARVARPVRV